jgi:hypothetical protein
MFLRGLKKGRSPLFAKDERIIEPGGHIWSHESIDALSMPDRAVFNRLEG